MRILKRNTLRCSPNEDTRQLWSESTTRFVSTETRLISNASIYSAMSSLKKDQQFEAWNHICSLTVQGGSVRMIQEVISKRSIMMWSTCMSRSSAIIHNFALKALQSQLPTAANLVRWKRIPHGECTLCGGTKPQTNKHVLSNCGSPVALARYKGRHNGILVLLATWLRSVLKTGQSLYADLDSSNFLPVRDLFNSSQPDLAVMDSTSVYTWELTVCHESNMIASKLYKENKYRLLRSDISSVVGGRNLLTHTVEISTLGFVSDTEKFKKAIGVLNIPNDLINAIAAQALRSSFSIYCDRNNANTSEISTPLIITPTLST